MKHKKEFPHLTLDELKRFFKRVDDHEGKGYERELYRCLFYMAYKYGLRRSEIAHLNLDDVNFRTGKVKIWRAKKGVGNYFTLFKEVRKRLRSYLKHRTCTAGETALFINPRTGQRYSEKAVGFAAMFRTIIAEAGLAGYSIHCLRHSIAYHMANGDIPPEETMDLLGHNDISSTLIYYKIGKERRHRYAQAMEESEEIL